MAIHASKNWPRKIEAIRYTEPFFSVLDKAGYIFTGQFPTGAVIATCNLVDIYEIGLDFLKRKTTGQVTYIPLPTEDELAFGDYTPGRFAWKLEDVKILKEPITAKGKLGLWEWDAKKIGGEHIG